MTTVAPVVPVLPTARPADRPLDPPDELVSLCEQAPMARLRYPDGHLGWLATGYDAVRTVLADRRFSSRYELMHFPIPGTWIAQELPVLPPAPIGDMTGIDPPAHTRFRRPLVGWFTVRRMRALEQRVAAVADDLLDAMAARSGPVDLVEDFARPLPARMICELLGVPVADRALFTAHTLTLTDFHTGGEETVAALEAMHAYLLDLVAAKRAEESDDVLGVLANTPDGDLTDDELAGLGALLLSAGLDTTANMIALGTYALFGHPDQLAALRRDPATAVEELLRWLTIGHTNLRAAVADAEIGGHTVAAGETVTLAMQAANRDPRRFPDGDRLDLGRDASGQLAFGHGVHQCLGQQLARVELRAALPALVERFPSLRLAVEPDTLSWRDANLYGVHALPVTWEAS